MEVGAQSCVWCRDRVNSVPVKIDKSGFRLLTFFSTTATIVDVSSGHFGGQGQSIKISQSVWVGSPVSESDPVNFSYLEGGTSEFSVATS